MENPFLWLIDTIIQLYIWILIAAAILSWLIAFNVVNTRNNFVAAVANFFYHVTEPVLRPIRAMLAQPRRHRYLAGGPDHRLAVSRAHHFLAVLLRVRLGERSAGAALDLREGDG